MTIDRARIDAWLGELGLRPVERGEREGILSWDVVLDGRRRHDIRTTLILDPALALVVWVQYAPPINDSFRVSYRKLLRWNDELPFVKFAISSDERPVLTAELPLAGLDVDLLGATLARLVAVCDLLIADSTTWLWPRAKAAPAPLRAGRNERLLERYASVVAEVTGSGEEERATDVGTGDTGSEAGARGVAGAAHDPVTRSREEL